MKRLFLTAVIATLATPAASLDMAIHLDPREGLAYLNMWGPIVAGDAQKFRAIVTPALQRGYLLFQVNVFSQGGVVREATAIGDQIQTLRARTVAPTIRAGIWSRTVCRFTEPDGALGLAVHDRSDGAWCTCASACFAIWMAGVTRHGDVVGIHRFHLSGATLARLTAAEVRALESEEERRESAYYARMGTPRRLVERMFATPPDDMHFLEHEDFAALRSTPGLDEMAATWCSGPLRRAVTSTPVVLPDDPATQSCFRAMLKQVMREGVRRYLLRSS